ncbi:MAG: N-acetylmuramoyl-L-alanine amidase [Paludibacteraceae bacterium]|nr:N-acetylmuramoyl-L-alanine amidase [Paludibacteraceae bacterium]
MKKILLFVVALMTSAVMMAQLDGKKIYVNPGHGSYGPNDRPCATIPFPNLSTTGMPDTLGFYESNTNLWKTLELGRKLEAAGAVVMHSRTQCGPWPYQYPYSDYTYDDYKALPDYEKYNKALSVICEEVDAFGADMFISVHSNAATEGTSTNYPLVLYRGTDAEAKVAGSIEMGKTLWPYLIDCMVSGLDPNSYYSKTSMNVRGDITFYGCESNGHDASHLTIGHLGALKHGAPGYLSEGYFHTYQPARHRALNPDYCKQEGIRYYRGIAAYFGEEPETKGYIMGTVKDLHEKMSHNLYNYAAKSNDQWVPCNGAVVTLYKGGQKVAEYNVDTLYNGIFYFPDLEPGNDYTLDATCEGYKPLFDDYKEPLTVKANETTYPMIFMESESYEPPKVVYVDYPDVATASEIAPSTVVVTNAGDTTYATIEGTIKRTIQRGDSTIILSHTEDAVAHLYLVNNKTNTIATIPTDSIAPIDTENVGSYLALSDVAMSADGVLVGCNYIRCQYDDAQVKDGFKRGTLQFYRWDSLHVQPTKWVSTQHSSNYYQGNMGMSLALKGSIDDCTILFTGVHATYLGIRFSYMAVVDNVVASTGYTGYEIDELATFYQPRTGEPYLLQLSPRNAKADYVFDAPLTFPMEFALNYDTKQENTLLGVFASDSINLPAHASYIRYAGHSFMVTPYYNADSLVAGVRMYDVTEGFDKATAVKLNADLETPVKATYAAATVSVEKGNFNIRLITDNTITTFTTEGVEQPVVANIYAYALNVTTTSTDYVFTFKANENALSGDIIFYQNGVEVGRQALENVVKGENTISIKSTELPGEENVETAWAIELRGENVTKWAKLYTETAVSTYSRVFNTIDNSPESDYFGRIYAINRAGSLGNEANGLHVYSPEYVLENTTPYYSGQLGNPQRAAVDEFGTLYLADWSDSHSGVYLVDPANVSGGMTQFFQGTAASNGLITNNGVEVASGSPGLDIYGTGADTKLFVYCEDQGTTLPANSVYMYQIGQEDGTLKTSWGEAPTKVYALNQANGDGNIWCTSRGFFVSQNRSSGSNNSGVPALIFVDYEGNTLFNSGKEPYASIIDGNSRSAYAVTDDESRLIMQNGSNQFLVFDIEWAADNTPILTLAYIYEHGFTKNVTQMTFDYAGNLVVSGESGFNIFTLPTDNNVTTTPAKRSLVVTKGDSPITNVENNEISAVVYSNNGTIFVEAEAGAMIQVYTVLGQRLFAAEATTNLTAISNIPANIVLVKVNNQVVKVAIK